ncbi:16S rRNA (guanine(527)-N(7))-methyltransferase RsmG [Nitratireductor basaltis]|uniref:Ribosomal RNA small subunit methyltransferase G n=1 Tax=Nitratireductor basaltis TaxID=472175 RepID=A0A084U6D3_9HYPH|nr:16S rRNA (guanine(527)-N(7))-methyltransferase RsmG [Nitratireductor basaltis]KFB08519.1 Ribosomal RNA small subunit methyltransferase G [Nitratireductor basaltis]
MNSRYEALVKIAGPVSRETFDRLLAFEQKFLHWSKSINLAAPSTLPHIWERHILDSSQLVTHVKHADSLVDIGSGGGFPGAILAIMLADRTQVHLVESNRKKASFLNTVLHELGTPAQVHAKRIEDSYDLVGRADVVTARALAPLKLLLELASPWISGGASAYFHKGRDYQQEIAESDTLDSYDLLIHQDLVTKEGVILQLSKKQQPAAPGGE